MTARLVSPSGSIIYVGAPSGVATTDTAALQAAINAAPAGGSVRMSAGTYVLSTAGLTISKLLTIEGSGPATVDETTGLWTGWGTRLTLDDPAATAITVSAQGCRLRGFALQNTHATAPTNGAGILVTNGSDMRFDDVSVRGFYRNIDMQAGHYWNMFRCLILDFVQNGVRIQWASNSDGGDFTIEASTILSGPTYPGLGACILANSSGGMRLLNNKINTYTPITATTGVEYAVADGATPTAVILVGNSIEGFTTDVLIHLAGPLNTGSLQHLVIVSNELNAAPNVGNVLCAITPEAAGQISRGIIQGNLFARGGTALKLRNVDSFIYGPNSYAATVGAPVDVDNSVTNSFDGSAGIDPLAVALGYAGWRSNPISATSNAILSSQTIFAAPVFLPPGKTITGVVLGVNTAGAGTPPTGFFVGIASPTKMLAQSGNLASSPQLTSTGKAQLAFSASYVTNGADSPTGLYYLVVLENAAFGTTPLRVLDHAAPTGSYEPLAGHYPADATLGSGQTALPANGAAITLTPINGGYWMGCY